MRKIPIPGRNLVLVETDDRVVDGAIATRVFRWRAERCARRHAPQVYDMNGVDVTTYHLRIEKVGRMTYDIVPYQNVLVPHAG